MSLVNYDYYRDTYKGLADEVVFNNFYLDAYMILKEATLGKCDNYSGDEVRLCLCKLIDLKDKHSKVDEIANKGISSERVGEYSVSYSPVAPEVKIQEEKAILKSLLGLTGLLYRGV